MDARAFAFDGPPYLGRGVRIFIALFLGPVVALVVGALCLVVIRSLTGAESVLALAVGGAAGWFGLALLVLVPTPKPTPGSVVIDDEKIVRTWRGFRFELTLADLAQCDLREVRLVLRDRGGAVTVVEDPGVDLRALVEEVQARLRQRPDGAQILRRLAGVA